MRTSVAVAVAFITLVGLSVAEDVDASVRTDIRIPAGGLGPALRTLSAERRIHLVYLSEDVSDLRTSGVDGSLTTEEALKRLLDGTGLTFQHIDEDTVGIVPANRTDSEPGSSAAGTQGREGAATTSMDALPENHFRGRYASFNDALGVAASAKAEGENTGPTRQAVSASATRTTELGEIVVTAQKRQERLIDTPLSVSVVTADNIERLGAVQFRDFANTVAGLSFQTSGTGLNQITLRGVTTGFDIGPTIGIYVDEVPYGPSTTFALGAQLGFDAALFDLERVEVLRGPQGTLYGASTMGGLLKYVTTLPDSGAFGVRAQAGVSSTEGGDVNYHIAGSLNAPLGADKAALRVSGFQSQDAGYIDNIASGGDQNANQSDVYGGRGDLLLAPSDVFSIRLTAFAQNISRDGDSTGDYDYDSGAPLYGDLNQFRRLPEPFDQRFRLASGTIAYDFGVATLTSISSYQTVKTSFTVDATPLYGPFLPFFGLTPSAVGLAQDLETDKFTQELRFASAASEDQSFDWLVGAFYTHEDSEYDQGLVPFNLAGDQVPNTFYTYSGPSKYTEYAAFGDFTWYLTDRLDLTGGVRIARNEQEKSQIGTGAFGVSHPKITSEDDVVTYLANARYRFTEHATAYLRYATGYRPGGPNVLTSATASPTFDPDRLRSYEAGFRTETPDRNYSVDLSGYYIDWSDMQISYFDGPFAAIANADGGAKVIGSELTFTARPTEALGLTGAIAYQDARMSQDEPRLGADEDERLPNVPRLSAALDGEYYFSTSGSRPSIGATFRYVDDREASFDDSTGYLQYHLPDYFVADVRAGMTLGSADVQLYVHNVSDERGQLSAWNFRGPAQPSLLQPRTFGMSVSLRF